MTQNQMEHAVLQDIGLISILTILFASAFYYWFRRYAPDSISTFGKVPTYYYRPVDILLCVLVSAPFTLTLTQSPKEPDGAAISLTLLVANFIIMLGISAFVLLLFAKRSMLPNALGLIPKKPLRILAWATGGYIVFLALNGALYGLGLEQWLTHRLGEPQNQDIVNQLLHAENQRKIALIIGACVIAPFAEEIIFRGYLYPVVKKYTEPFIAAICTGILFGAVHGEIWAVIPISLLGIILALLYEWSGSIWTCILCHALFNSINVIVMLNFGDQL